MKADELMNVLLSSSLPEIDVDSFQSKKEASINEFADKKAQEFRQSASGNMLEISSSSNSAG